MVGFEWSGQRKIPAALHGIEASLLASDFFRKLRSSLLRVVWSRLGFVCFVVILLFGLLRLVVFYRLLTMVSEGSPGHGPIHLLLASAAEIGIGWDPLALAWSRPGSHLLSNLALDAWRNKVAADLCGREGFRGGPLLDVLGSLQLLNSAHVTKRDKALLRSVVVGSVWSGFLLGRVRVSPCHVGAVVLQMVMVIFFCECTFPPLVEIRENPEFHDLMRMDKGHWTRCLLWHGWLPVLSGVNGAFPWVADASESASYLVEVALGRYSSGLVG